MTPKQLDDHHRTPWKQFATNKKIQRGTDINNTLMGLNKLIIRDNDRHLRVSGTSGNPKPNHQELRQRHLVNAFIGKDGYSIENVKHPQTGEHLGVRVKASRHHKNGNLGETSWFYNNSKGLTTEYNKLTGERWKQ